MTSSRRAAARAACALAAVLALSAATATAAAQEPRFADWNPTFPGYPSNVARDAGADCASGSDTCIDRTIAEMYRRFHTVIPVCDHNTVFSLAYIRVTEDVRRAIHGGLYPDRTWINRQDAMFARLYFISYSNWSAGRRDLLPMAWRIAYDSARDRKVPGFANLLLSMNAHIQRDFPFVLYHSGVRRPDGTSRRREHDAYNPRLRALYTPVIQEFAHRFDETFDDHDIPGTSLDDDALFQLLIDWRNRAFDNAERLAAARSDSERRRVAASIEDNAEATARLVLASLSYKVGANSAARDARCAVYGGQDPRLAKSVTRPKGKVSRRCAVNRRGHDRRSARPQRQARRRCRR